MNGYRKDNGLPLRVKQDSWLPFLLLQLVSALPGLALAFGPSAALWLFLSPAGFFQRLITLAACFVVFLFAGFGGFFLYAHVSAKTTGF